MPTIINPLTIKRIHKPNTPAVVEFLIMPTGYIELWWCSGGFMISRVGSNLVYLTYLVKLPLC